VSACKTFSHQQVHQLLDEVLGPGLHANRIASLARDRRNTSNNRPPQLKQDRTSLNAPECERCI
jgi:hypothetical protein